MQGVQPTALNFVSFISFERKVSVNSNELRQTDILRFFSVFLQIKRLLPSGAAARSQQIRVGDRLLSCNGISLRNVSQSKCLSVLKSEGNSGDLELELLRQKENEDLLEISLKVSNTDSTVTLHSPSQQRKNFIADLPESDSENEVVLNKFQYINNSVLNQELRTIDQNQKSEVPKLENVKKLNNSDSIDTNCKRDIGLKSKNPNMEESGESWNYAVPPPAEFSTYGPAVPPPAEFSEGQSPIFNQSNNGIPVTNIDEIIQSYRQSPVVQSQESCIPQSQMDDTEEQIRHMEPLTGLQRDESDSLDNSLTYFNENLPDEKGFDVMDSFQGDNDINQFVQGDQDVDAVDAEPFIPPAPINIEDIDVVNSNDDDEFVVPVTVQRQNHIPFTSTVTVSSVSPTEIEEEQIVPSVELRKRVPTSATIKLEEKKHEGPPPKPVPQPRVKSTVINVERSPAPQISSMSDGQVVEEEMVRAEFKERQSGNEKFREKLGGEVEEEMVAVEVKRNQNWNATKLAVITNMWSKSARKNNDSEDNGEQKNLKSVINVMNSKKKQDVNTADDLLKKDKVEIVKEETNSEVIPREQSLHKNVIEVSAPVHIDTAKWEDKAEKMESVSPTDKQTIRQLEPVKTEMTQQTVTVNNAIVDSKPAEIEHAPAVSAAQTTEKAPTPVLSKATEENIPSTTLAKSTQATSPSPFKSSIAITKPSSLLSTIRSQNTSSATLKPLSSIRPVTVSAKTFSLGKPASLSSSLSSGRISLLSTIHGTSTSAKNTRSEEEPFLVSVLKGILGLGMKVSLTPEGCVRVDEIQSSGPIAKDGNIR